MDALLERAERAGLHEHPQWLALGHYERGAFGWRSRAGADFLLSPEGEHDPQRELVATLRAFINPAANEPADERAQCRFPARFRWLNQMLDIGALIPAGAAVCSAYEDWRAELDVRGVSLIFPEGFMESPASMFGHTLLRLDTGTRVGEHEMLGHAVDFTALTAGDEGLIYLLKGISGFYPGFFNVTPYYAQLRRYAEWENRDIWEYPLSLTTDEVELLVGHLWELRDIPFPYLFFTRNCSQLLLALIEVARPGLARGGGVPPMVIPADTVRSLTAMKGLLRAPFYRASPATELRHLLRGLNRDERRWVRAVVEGEGEGTGEGELALDALEQRDLDVGRKRVLLEAVYKSLRYAYLAGRISEAESRPLSRRVLIARSRLGTDPQTDKVESAAETRGAPPDQGHGSAMFALEGGIDDGNGYVDLLFRPAYHDLMDADAGFTKDMQVEFLSGRVRYYPGLDRVRLQELSLVEVTSLSPRSRVFKPLAWRFETAIRTRKQLRERDGELEDRGVWHTGVGVGLSFDPQDWLLTYGLFDLNFDVGPHLDHKVSFGPGAMLGLYLRPASDRFRTHLFGRVTYFAAGDDDTVIRAGIEERLAISRKLGLRFEASFNRASGQNWFVGGASLRFYF